MTTMLKRAYFFVSVSLTAVLIVWLLRARSNFPDICVRSVKSSPEIQNDFNLSEKGWSDDRKPVYFERFMNRSYYYCSVLHMIQADTLNHLLVFKSRLIKVNPIASNTSALSSLPQFSPLVILVIYK